MAAVKRGVTKRLADSEVVDQILERIEHIEENTVAASEVGMSEATLRRWREGDRRPLRKQVRAKLLRYLEGVTNSDSEGATSEAPPLAALSALADMKQRIEELERYWQAQLELARARPKAMPTHMFKQGGQPLG